MTEIRYIISPPIDNAILNLLFAAAWGRQSHKGVDFTPIHERSLVYICAFEGEQLVGYVNVAWDGGIHAFLLDTTIHPEWQRRGVGTELVKHAAEAAKTRGMEWLHVDFEPHLLKFYRKCGFTHTEAGLMDLTT